ncbi:Gfo/Idh/MocA family protein [Gemmatimonadota bacterium]
MSEDCNRRDFLKKTTAAGIGMSVAASGLAACSSEPRGPAAFFTVPPLQKVRVGFVGIGHQGSGHVRNLLRIPGAELAAVCDIVPDKVAQAQQWAVDAGQMEPVGYSNGHEDFRRMCAEEDLDLVYTATPWRWHAPVMLEAMRNDKHAATEIPMAISLDECWELVETSEKTRRHCVAM